MTCTLLCSDPHHVLSQALAQALNTAPLAGSQPLGTADGPVVLLQCPTAVPLPWPNTQQPVLEVAPWHLERPPLLPGGAASTAARLRHASLFSDLLHQDDNLADQRLLLWPYGERSVAFLADGDLIAAIVTWLQAPWTGERCLEGPMRYSAEELAAAMSTAIATSIEHTSTFAKRKFAIHDRDGNGWINADEFTGAMLDAGLSVDEVGWLLDRIGNSEGVSLSQYSAGLEPMLAATLAEVSSRVKAVTLETQAAASELLQQGWTPAAASALTSVPPPANPITATTRLEPWLERRAVQWINVDILPTAGVAGRQQARLDGQPALLFRYRRVNGVLAQMLRSSDFRRVSVQRLDLAPAGTDQVISWRKEEVERTLTLRDGCLIGIDVRGHWSDLFRAEKLLLVAEPLPQWMLVVFKRSGQFQLQQEQPSAPHDLVCRCVRVTCSRVAGLIEAQPGLTVAELARQTKATTICGGCIPLLESWLAIGGAMPPGCELTATEPEAGLYTPVVASSVNLAAISDVGGEARAFLEQCYGEQGVGEGLGSRLAEVDQALQQRGSYSHTYDELAYGAKLAWRNSNRCLGRHLWQELIVRDRRALNSEEEMFEAILDHIEAATNGGDLRSTITVFKPDGRRIWNPQFCRYAGYRQSDGSVLGDPMQLAFTDAVLAMGWEPKERTRFDLLPIVIQLPGREPCWFELPKALILEVAIEHPHYPWFAELGLQWYGLPAVTNMAFDVGGIQYTAAPFNGFYMGTEVGARNFGDSNRYDQLPLIAERLGLDTSSERTLWRDRAVIELNVAVLHSYEKAGIRMADHHTLTRSFMDFTAGEHKSGRRVQIDPRYVVPPISASLTPTFHATFDGEQILKPNFFFQNDPWSHEAPDPNKAPAQGGCPFHQGG